MLICEVCSASFEPAAGAAAVSTTRVLCPNCLAKRQRARVEPQAAASAQRSAPQARTASPSRPPAAPRRDPTNAPRSSRRDAVERPQVVHHAHVSPMKPVIKMASMLAGGLCAIALGLAWYANHKTEARQQVAAEKKAKVETFIRELRNLDLSLPNDARTAVAKIQGDALTASDGAIASEVQRVMTKATTTIADAKAIEETMAAIADIEAKVAQADSMSSAAIAELQQRINRLAPNAQEAGEGVKKQLEAARATIAKAYVKRLHAEAIDMRASNGAKALEIYAKVEDAINDLAKAAHAKSDVAGEKELLTQLEETVKESDAVCAEVYTESVISGTPMRDLIAMGTKIWNASEVKGFAHRIQGGALIVAGPDKDAARRAVMSTGDQEKWRDLVVDTVVERTKGTIVLCFRLLDTPDASTVSVPLDSKNCPEGQPTHLTINVVGGRLVVKAEGNPEPLLDVALPWDLNRKGAFGIIVPPEAQVRFTKLGVRVLR